MEGLIERTPPKCRVLLIEDDRPTAGNKADIDVEANLSRFRWNDECGFPVESQRCELSLFAEFSDHRIVGAFPGVDTPLDEGPLSVEGFRCSPEEQKLVTPGNATQHDGRDAFLHRPAAQRLGREAAADIELTMGDLPRGTLRVFLNKELAR